MLNVNSYNVKYRVFVCVAHKLIPFHKTRRSQSPPGGPIPCWHIVAWFGTTAYPLSLSYDRCLALPRPALPRPAQPGHGCFRILPANVMRWRWDTKIVVSSFVAGLSRNPCCRPVAFPRLCSARRPYAACLHITPFPAVACFPLPKACACRARTCWGFLRPVPAFSGPLPRHSPSPGVVKTIYTYTNFTSIKISYMYTLNQKNTAGTKQHRRSRPAGHKKAPHEEGRRSTVVWQ